ncbi:MAG: hypothetical protein ACRD0B_09185, partial [Acidimicrobiales bacterium]
EVLAGQGPADVVDVTLALAREMLALARNEEEHGRGGAGAGAGPVGAGAGPAGAGAGAAGAGAGPAGAGAGAARDAFAEPGKALADGRARSYFEAMVRAQGGDLAAPLPRASHVEIVRAPRAGFVRRLDARAVGVAAWRLGAGRARREDPVSAGAGVLCSAKPGETVEAGDALLELHADDPRRFERARAALEGAIEIESEPPDRLPLVIEVIRP